MSCDFYEVKFDRESNLVCADVRSNLGKEGEDPSYPQDARTLGRIEYSVGPTTFDLTHWEGLLLQAIDILLTIYNPPRLNHNSYMV
jgi:hypothetical protein